MAKETFTRDKPTLSIPPKPAGLVTSITPVSTAGVLTTLTVQFDNGDTTGFYWVTQATSPQGIGQRKPARSAYKLIQSTLNVGLVGVLDILTTYNARFGAINLGEYLWVQMFLIDSVSGVKYDYGRHTAIITGT